MGLGTMLGTAANTVGGALSSGSRTILGVGRGVANTVTLVARTPAAMITGDWSGVKTDLSDLKDTAKGLAYSSAEFACLALAPATGGATLGLAFGLSYAETKDRGGFVTRLKRGTLA